jgi:hypothetical protein
VQSWWALSESSRTGEMRLAENTSHPTTTTRLSSSKSCPT